MTKEERRALDLELITGVLRVPSDEIKQKDSPDRYWLIREFVDLREFSPTEFIEDAFECLDALDSICKERSLTLRFSLNNIKSALGAYHFIIKIIPDDLLLVGAYADDDGAIFAIGDAEERAEAIATACREAWRAIKKESE